MVVPIRQQAAEQIRAPQEGRVGSRGAAEHEVIAAAGARVAAIEHEFLGTQARGARGAIEELGSLHQLAPVMRGLHIGFDDPGIGRYAE